MPLNRLNTRPGAIGARRCYVQFCEPGMRDSASGGTLAPNPVFSEWMDIRGVQGYETNKAYQISQEVDHVATMGYREGLSENMILLFDGRSFQIKAIEDEEERKFELKFWLAEIGQNAGGQV